MMKNIQRKLQISKDTGILYSFGRHDFVRALKRKLEENLSPLIDDELEKYSTTGHIDSGSHETLVNQIINHIIQSKQ